MNLPHPTRSREPQQITEKIMSTYQDTLARLQTQMQNHSDMALERLARTMDTFRLLAFQRKALQYRMQCEQPVNSRLFLEAFFLNYAATFTPS